MIHPCCEVSCPKCGAARGFKCFTASGRSMRYAYHVERTSRHIVSAIKHVCHHCNGPNARTLVPGGWSHKKCLSGLEKRLRKRIPLDTSGTR